MNQRMPIQKIFDVLFDIGPCPLPDIQKRMEPMHAKDILKMLQTMGELKNVVCGRANGKVVWGLSDAMHDSIVEMRAEAQKPTNLTLGEHAARARGAPSKETAGRKGPVFSTDGAAGHSVSREVKPEAEVRVIISGTVGGTSHAVPASKPGERASDRVAIEAPQKKNRRRTQIKVRPFVPAKPELRLCVLNDVQLLLDSHVPEADSGAEREEQGIVLEFDDIPSLIAALQELSEARA